MGGIHAIAGFDLQAAAILEEMLDLFEAHPESARIRPEGLDDLDVTWTDGGAIRRRHYQIKKQLVGADGATHLWSLAEVARQLLAPSLHRLDAEDVEQVWILGDAVHTDVRELVAAGRDAPETARGVYLHALHRVAKHETNVTRGSDAKSALDRFVPGAIIECSVSSAIKEMISKFRAIAVDVDPASLDRYEQQVHELHRVLPSALARVRVRDGYGHERAVVERVIARLEARYGIDHAVAQRTLFRNLRGYINDVSKLPGHTIDRSEFEQELVSIWPHAVAARVPPDLDRDHILRPRVVAEILTTAPFREVLGPSGSGKTMIATEVYAHLRQDDSALAVYAEVRPDTTLRDVLAGVGFALRRRGAPGLFGATLHLRESDEQALHRVADALAGMRSRVVLLIDAVEGTAGNSLRQDLARFAALLEATPLRVLIFSQASLLQNLSEMERARIGIEDLRIPGFHFGEFRELVRRHHPRANDEELRTVYDALNRGRSDGLLPSEAHALARARSVPAMLELAARPPESMLREAHMARYREIHSTLLGAAGRLVCFSLPPTIDEIAGLFPEDPMRAAAAAMVSRGLARRDADGTISMHETVRAGLEVHLPPAVARSTHERLAEHFAETGAWTAQIHHLERAGRTREAHNLARERFVAGEQRSTLHNYVAEHRLLTDSEVISLLVADDVPALHVMPELLRRVRTSSSGDQLMDAIRERIGRLDTDSHWGWWVLESLLTAAPEKLLSLVQLGLSARSEDDQRARFERITFAARRARSTPGADFLAWFSDAARAAKLLACPLLLVGAEERCLAAAFSFMQEAGLRLASRNSARRDFVLELVSDADVRAFLSALPTPETARLFVERSPLLGFASHFVSSERTRLRGTCRALLEDSALPRNVLFNAFRVLVQLGDRAALELARTHRELPSVVRDLAWFVPVLLGARDQRPEFEGIARAAGSGTDTRLAAATIAAALGADLDALYGAASKLDPNPRAADFLFMMLASVFPFPAAVGILYKTLQSPDPSTAALVGPVLARVAELGAPGTIDLLLKALENDVPELNVMAAMALQRRRSPRALAPLLALAERVGDTKVAGMFVTAAIASRPATVAELLPLWARHPALAHWRWIVAGRLRAGEEVPALLEVAADTRTHWQVRRVALLALGRIPEASQALLSISPAILAESSSLPDTDPSLNAHALLGHMLRAEDLWVDLVRAHRRGRGRFVDIYAPVYEEWRRSMIARHRMVPGTDAIGWLWDALERAGIRERPANAIDRVRDLVSTPMLHDAVLRGLRMHGHFDELQCVIRNAHHEWQRIRAFRELTRRPDRHEARAALEALIAELPQQTRFVYKSILGDRPRGAPRSADAHIAGVDADWLSLAAARSFMRGAGDARKMPILLDVSEDGFLELLRELDPRLDTHWQQRRARTTVVTHAGGAWRLSGADVVPVSENVPHRRALRAALAAANRFAHAIPWHEHELLHETYARQFLVSLAAHSDKERFYGALANSADLLIPLVDRYDITQHLFSAVDERIVPFLTRYALTGTDEFFEQLCHLAARIPSAEGDVALARLFERLIGLFVARRAERWESIPIWRAFHAITAHPRFHHVPKAMDRLSDLLLHQLDSRDKRQIARVLREQPGAYLMFETAAMRAETFEHFHRDELDEYDDAADELFRVAPTDE